MSNVLLTWPNISLRVENLTDAMFAQFNNMYQTVFHNLQLHVLCIDIQLFKLNFNEPAELTRQVMMMMMKQGFVYSETNPCIFNLTMVFKVILLIRHKT